MKIGKKFSKIMPATWRLAKKRAMYLNRRQNLSVTYPPYTYPENEILFEQSTEFSYNWLQTEQSTGSIYTDADTVLVITE